MQPRGHPVPCWTRRDVLIVASVSCIYGLGSPDFVPGHDAAFLWKRGIDHGRWTTLLAKLVEMQYERNDYDFHRGTFRVRGDTLEIISGI